MHGWCVGDPDLGTHYDCGEFEADSRLLFVHFNVCLCMVCACSVHRWCVGDPDLGTHYDCGGFEADSRFVFVHFMCVCMS